MTEITRKKTVEYVVYIAKDGKEFNSKKECIFYEKKLDGDIIDCPECHGTGKVESYYEYDNYHTGVVERVLTHPTCKKCKGRGYLEKTIVYQ